MAGAVLATSAAGCGSTGVVETHRIKGSEAPPPANDADGGGGDSCPSGWTCMDITALGFSAADGDGEPVTATCSKGTTPTACDDADPAASCKELSDPICAHLKVGGQDIVSCGQRCTP